MSDYLAESYDKALREIESLRARLAEAIAEGNHWKDAYAEDVSKLDARLAEAVACCTIKDNRNLWLEIRLKKIMARCADLLDEDQFNDLDAIATATVSAPAVCPECLGTGMGGTGGICRCKCGTNSASVTQEKNL